MDGGGAHPLFGSKNSTGLIQGSLPLQACQSGNFIQTQKWGLGTGDTNISHRELWPLGLERWLNKLRAVAALAKDPELIPSILIAALAPPTVTVSEDLMLPSSDLPGMHVVHMQAEHAYT